MSEKKFGASFEMNLAKLFLCTGIFCGIFPAVYYSIYGFSNNILLIWLLSILILGAHFFRKSEHKKVKIGFGKRDLFIIICITLLFAPVYLYNTYKSPFPIVNDELINVIIARTKVFTTDYDIFKPTGYIFYPSFVFIFFGWTGKIIFGSITIYSMRFLTAVFGLITIPASYLFFRLFSGRKTSMGAAVILGSSHVFLALSRMALSNIAYLFNVISLGLFYLAYKHEDYFYVFLGSLCAGISFYSYFTGRFVFIFWTIFLILIIVFKKKHLGTRKILNLYLASALVFFIIIGPLVIPALVNSQNSIILGQGYLTKQLLLFEDGRSEQQLFVNAPTPAAGVIKNVIDGITIFNNKIQDRSAFYPNVGHGFFDFLTGIFIIAGAVLLLGKKNKKEHELLILGCFFFLWFLYIFVINKAPTYNRVLAILPFSSYIAANCIAAVSVFLYKRTKIGVNLSFIVIIGLILILNFSYYNDFNHNSMVLSQPLGATGRFIGGIEHPEKYKFILVNNTKYPYFTWPYPEAYKMQIEFFTNNTRFNFFTAGHENVKIVPIENLTQNIREGPLIIFINGDLWAQYNYTIKNYYQKHILTPDHKLLAIELD